MNHLELDPSCVPVGLGPGRQGHYLVCVQPTRQRLQGSMATSALRLHGVAVTVQPLLHLVLAHVLVRYGRTVAGQLAQRLDARHAVLSFGLTPPRPSDPWCVRACACVCVCVCVCVCMLHTDIRTYIHIYREARGLGQWPYAAELLVYMALEREMDRSRPASKRESAGRELRMSDVVEVLGPLPVFARAVGSCARKVVSCVCVSACLFVCVLCGSEGGTQTPPRLLLAPLSPSCLSPTQVETKYWPLLLGTKSSSESSHGVAQIDDCLVRTPPQAALASLFLVIVQASAGPPAALAQVLCMCVCLCRSEM